MTAKQKYLWQFCLIFAGLLLGLLLAEGMVRLSFPHSRDHVIPGGLFEIDESLGWKLKAAKSALHHTRYFDVTYNINQLGYRDKPRSSLKDENVYRILLYGDSQIFGWGIPEGQRFSNLAEDQMSALEVWNLAVPGYGLDQQILSYEQDGKNLIADEVIFFVDKNTLERTRYDYIYNKHKPRFLMDQNGLLKLVSIPRARNMGISLFYRILSPLYLPYFVESRLAMLRVTPKRPDIKDASVLNTETTTIAEIEKSILGRVKNVALVRGHQLTIMVFLPESMRIDLFNFCNQKGIIPLEVFIPDQDDRFIIGEYDHHWNIQAHVLISNQFVAHLKRNLNH